MVYKCFIPWFKVNRDVKLLSRQVIILLLENQMTHLVSFYPLPTWNVFTREAERDWNADEWRRPPGATLEPAPICHEPSERTYLTYTRVPTSRYAACIFSLFFFKCSVPTTHSVQYNCRMRRVIDVHPGGYWNLDCRHNENFNRFNETSEIANQF